MLDQLSIVDSLRHISSLYGNNSEDTYQDGYELFIRARDNNKMCSCEGTVISEVTVGDE